MDFDGNTSKFDINIEQLIQTKGWNGLCKQKKWLAKLND